MPNRKKYKIIAAFLLTVFSLNTVVGFACSVGVDMGFNSKHHHSHDPAEAIVHIHSDGKKHIHSEKKNAHHHGKSNHDNRTTHHHTPGTDKDNCCNDHVLKFEQLDKSIPHPSNIVHPIFLISFFDVYYNAALPSCDVVKDIKQFVRSYHPPISNIRVAIQSFQI
jgi:hypothetical protein